MVVIKNIAKITLHICTKDNKNIETNCEFIGVIAYYSYMLKLTTIVALPHPILNFSNHVKGLEKL